MERLFQPLPNRRITIQISLQQRDRIDEYRQHQTPYPSRTDAVISLIDMGFKHIEYVEHVDKNITDALEIIDRLIEKRS